MDHLQNLLNFLRKDEAVMIGLVHGEWTISVGPRSADAPELTVHDPYVGQAARKMIELLRVGEPPSETSLLDEIAVEVPVEPPKDETDTGLVMAALGSLDEGEALTRVQLSRATGVNSKRRLAKAVDELLDAGLIEQSVGLNHAHIYWRSDHR